jgi:phage terminase small subunit
VAKKPNSNEILKDAPKISSKEVQQLEVLDKIEKETKVSLNQKLTIQQRVFISEYLIDFNAARAASAAGYTKNINPSSLFKFPHVQQELNRRVDMKIKASMVTAEYVIGTLYNISNDEYTKNSDRIRALELLGKHLNMFTDKIDLKADTTSTGDIKVVFDDKLKEWAK